MNLDLTTYDLILVNSSAGKDSQTALAEIIRQADAQAFPRDRIHVVHADLGNEEWPGVPELARRQAAHYGLAFHKVARRQADGSSDSILAYTMRRGKWPSSTTRWCTSEFKRSPCMRVLTRLSRQYQAARVLNVFGFRAEESPARAKREPLALNKRASTKTRTVHDYLPIHEWTEDDVWADIRASGVAYHWAYDLGMPRLSCCFCVFAPRAALIVAGKARPELLAQYVQVEKLTGHTFRAKQSLEEVQQAIEAGEEPEKMSGTWNM